MFIGHWRWGTLVGVMVGGGGEGGRSEGSVDNFLVKQKNGLQKMKT